MGDYANRNRQGFDKEQESISEQTATIVITGSGIRVGENVETTVAMKHNGTLGNADNTLDANVEESDDDSTYTVLQAMPQLTATATKVTANIRTTKQYVRVKSAAAAGTAASVGGFQAYLES